VLVFDGGKPRGFGGKSGGCMMVTNKLGLGFEFIDVVYGLICSGAIWEEFCRGAGENDGVGVVVAYHVYQRNSVHIENWIAETTEDGAFAYGEGGVIGVIDIDHLLVEYCDIICICKFAHAEERMLTDAWGDVEFVGWRSDVEWVFGKFGYWDDFTVG
jgi:hypothetical protein